MLDHYFDLALFGTHTTSLVHRLKHALNAISCRLSFCCISSGKNELIIVICSSIFQIEFHNLKIFSIACSAMHVNVWRKMQNCSNLKFLQFNCSLFRFAVAFAFSSISALVDLLFNKYSAQKRNENWAWQQWKSRSWKRESLIVSRNDLIVWWERVYYTYIHSFIHTRMSDSRLVSVQSTLSEAPSNVLLTPIIRARAKTHVIVMTKQKTKKPKIETSALWFPCF